MINESSKPAIIAKWQTALDKAGFRGDMDPSKYGSWGPKTEAATKAFKKAMGLPENSIVDTETAAAMWEASNLYEVTVLQSKINAAKAALG